MLLGIDLDNTIICYDNLYWTLALEHHLFEPSATPLNKVALRDHLHSQGREDIWTELQGIAYGSRLSEASPFPGVTESLVELSARGFQLAIVSHKTAQPYKGPPYDLHKAARRWLEENDLFGDQRVSIASDAIYLELTRDAKLRRIGQIQCDYFIDDLPDVLTDHLFPRDVDPILFDPMDMYSKENLPTMRSWAELNHLLAPG